MKVKISRTIKLYMLPLVLFILIIGISGFLPYGIYVSIAALYVALNYYMILGVVRMGGKDRSKENIYEWLDVLDGSEDLIKRLVMYEKRKDVMSNLEIVFEKIMFITNKDKKRLRLLKGYFKTLSDEGSYDLFVKTFLTIIVAICAWGINKGFLFAISKANIEDIKILANPTFLVVCNYVTFLILGLITLAMFIKISLKEKTRIKILLEVIDTCLEELKDN